MNKQKRNLALCNIGIFVGGVATYLFAILDLGVLAFISAIITFISLFSIDKVKKEYKDEKEK